MADLVIDARPQIAIWDEPLDAPNLEDASIRHKLAGLAKLPGLARFEAGYRKRFRHKTWQYMTAVGDDCFVAFIIGTAGFAGNGFIYIVEPSTGRVHSHFAITPLSKGVELAPSSTAGTHRFSSKHLQITIENLNGGRRFLAKASGEAESGPVRFELAFESAPRDQHLALCVPLAGGRWNYTHKFGAFDVDGVVEVEGRRLEVVGYGSVDFTKSYALRHAVWRWIALAGRTRAGKVIGLNLVDPTPAAPFSENCAWIEGKRIALADVQLSADRPSDPDSPWQLRATGLEASMRWLAHVEQKLEVPLVRHRLRHVVGAFSGRLRTANGESHDLDELVGIAEDNDTWW